METSGRDHGRSALVLYGTETGASQDLAEDVGRTLERLLFNVDVTGCDSATHQDFLAYDLTVLLVSTTGQGDFPSNARKLWSGLLRRKLPSHLLNGMRFALVGLCDSSYPKFNWAARKLEKRLHQLGAEEILVSCEADEQGEDSTEGAFLVWLDQFKSAVLDRFPLPEGREAVAETVNLPSKWLLRQALDADLASPHSTTANGASNGYVQQPSLLPDAFPATLELNDRITPPSHWQDVRSLRLHTSEQVTYLPGDALAISPENLPHDVDTLLDLMDWTLIANTPLLLYSTSSTRTVSRLQSPPISLIPNHTQLTLRALLTTHLDINAIPRRSFFSQIARYTNDSMHKERLLEFTEPQYLDEYYDYATRPRRSIIEILQEFDSVRIPWQEVINIIPPMRPRQFSIASGGVLKTASDDGGTVFELLVAIVKYRTVIKRIREGVCTRYLAQLPVGTRINIALRTEGRFFSETQVGRNHHLLIGAGTGIAPLRALIHEKAMCGEKEASTTLVFGARNENADYFFSEEWDRFSNQGLELKVFPAFSRDQREKFYVQDRLRKLGRELRPMLMDEDTVVIVCGAAGQMPKAVWQALVDVLCSQPLNGKAGQELEAHGDINMSADEAEKFIFKMEKDGRYKQETWS